MASLSPRQVEIGRLIVQGMPNKQIALSLGITEQTVKAHITAMFEKMAVNNRLALGFEMIRRGTVTLPGSNLEVAQKAKVEMMQAINKFLSLTEVTVMK